jgi:hypothetical protein
LDIAPTQALSSLERFRNSLLSARSFHHHKEHRDKNQHMDGRGNHASYDGRGEGFITSELAASAVLSLSQTAIDTLDQIGSARKSQQFPAILLFG